MAAVGYLTVEAASGGVLDQYGEMPPGASLFELGGRLLGIARLVRLRSTVSAPVLTLLGWCVSTDLARSPVLAVAGSVSSSFALMAYAQVFNDIRDRRLDAITKPERPIPAGLVPVRLARVIAVVLAVAALAAAPLAGLPTVLACLACLLVATAYSLWGKRIALFGHLMVAAVSASMLGYGVVSRHELSLALWIGTVTIFLYILGNEMFKVVSDAEGDHEFGLSTVATRYGRDTAALLIRGACVSLFAVYTVAGLLSLVAVPFVSLGLVGVVLPTGLGAARLRRHTDSGGFDTAHRWWRAAWVPGLLTLTLL